MKLKTQDHTNNHVKDEDVLSFNPNGGGADYVMHKRAQNVWITVGKISVLINNTGEKVRVELYPHFHEACCPPLDYCGAEHDEKRIADKDHESAE